MKVNRYTTKGIENKLPLEIQAIIWDLQIELRSIEDQIDYLQVYELKAIESNSKCMQVICHLAELPKYENIYYYEVKEPVLGKVFVMEERVDQEIIETMMFAEEY